MTFFSRLYKKLIKKTPKEIKPASMEVWLEQQRIIAAAFEKKKNLKKTVLKKKRAITAPTPKVKKPKAKGKRNGSK